MTGNGSIEEGRDRGMNQSPFGRQNGILHEDRINNKAKMKKASGRDKNRLFPLDAPTHQCREQKSYEDHKQWLLKHIGGHHPHILRTECLNGENKISMA